MVETISKGDQRVHDVATGQKLIIVALVISFLVLPGIRLVAHNSPPDSFLFWAPRVTWGVIGLLALLGVIRMAEGFNYPIGIWILLVVLLFIPFINIAMLLVINNRANKTLESAGHRVGFLGIRR